MTINNRDRAEMAVAYGILHGKTHDQIVDMLDANGLLMPDLPEPDQDGLWCPKVPTIEFVQSTGYTVHAVGGLARLDLTRDEALDFAAILTAAADYDERNHHEHD